jgi:hypothetical protein
VVGIQERRAFGGSALRNASDSLESLAV